MLVCGPFHCRYPLEDLVLHWAAAQEQFDAYSYAMLLCCPFRCRYPIEDLELMEELRQKTAEAGALLHLHYWPPACCWPDDWARLAACSRRPGAVWPQQYFATQPNAVLCCFTPICRRAGPARGRGAALLAHP